MPIQLKGYVLEPPRVGGSNSPFTMTPNVEISNRSAFDAAYPAGETAPRTEYMVQVLGEDPGTGPEGATVLADAVFAWTKNEGAVQAGLQVPFQRFGYSGQDQRFRPLQGAPREAVGTLAANANTVRLAVPSVPQLADLTSFPVRLSVGATGSGTTFTVVLVQTFTTPAAGTVQMDPSGALNWNPSNISSNVGAPVYFQRQAFYQANETDGVIGAIGSDPILLNPLPASGQIPAIKIGERAYLTAVARATESAFSADPAAGTVEWARSTGRLKFNSALSASLGGQPVVYDGVFFGTFKVPTASLGFAQNMPCGTLAGLPAEASDVHFRIVGQVQFAETVFVDAFDAGKKGRVQIRRGDRAVQLSAADRAAYAGKTVEAVLPDVLIERGISLRLFRSPLNPDGATDGAKDVTAVHSVVDAKLADPMVGQPFVFLPALPREDADLTVQVKQGTGSFVGTLERLDVGSPPVGKGYKLNFAARQLEYVERRSEVLTASMGPTLQLSGAPVSAVGLKVERQTSPGNYADLVENVDFTIDRGSGLLTWVDTLGATRVVGTKASVSGATLTVAENLSAANVAVGQLVVVPSGLLKGVYTITDVVSSTKVDVYPPFGLTLSNVAYEIRSGKEILADRFFREVPRLDPNTQIERINALGTVTNSPRLMVESALVERIRFRYGKTRFSSSVEFAWEGFTPPDELPTGHVEVDSYSGELNFSQEDVDAGGTVYLALRLRDTDYRIQPTLGFIELADRLLEREEVYIRYAVPSPNKDDEGGKLFVEERGVFLVRKEATQPHPEPTSILTFNPLAREVASTPSPVVFRGGRRQSAERVAVELDTSTLTFSADSQMTDALPHGPIVGPSENVFVDYHVYEALGGERSLTVSRTPMVTAKVAIVEGETSFTVEGDRTADFPTGLLEVDGSEVYLTAAPTFDGTKTTVALDQATPQAFRTGLTDPTLKVTSGPIRRFAAGAYPAYFVNDLVSYDPIARGSKQIRLLGDRSRTYVAGTVLAFTDSVNYQHYYRIEGATFDADSWRTVVVLSSPTLRQYADEAVLRTIRPIFASASTVATTAEVPVLTLPYLVYRQVEGEPGYLLTEGNGFAIDASGQVTLTDQVDVSGQVILAAPLRSNEEVAILYTGIRKEATWDTRVSWTFTIVPTVENGLENQVLEMSYSTYLPDTFFFRVETMTNFRGELADELREEVKASSPSQGPILENAGETPLYEQGRPSLFFEEGDLSNQDLVARQTLQFYNDVINDLESYLQGWDGRAVGDHDGLFLFDGKVDNPVRTAFAQATNQIDDLIQIHGATPKRAFEAAKYSRFYPTQRAKFGAAADPSGLSTGDPILDLGDAPLKAVVSVRTRAPWAVTTLSAPAGATVLQVDHARGDSYLLRPGLDVASGLKVAITTRTGESIVADASPVSIAATTSTSVTLSTPVAVDVPRGSTIRLASTDDAYRQTFTLGVDVGVDLDGGFLTHVASDDVPSFFAPNAGPEAGVPLDAVVQLQATSTSPDRFPALDGGTTDDDGDRQFPALGVDGGAERGNIDVELGLIGTSGTLALNVTAPLVTTVTVTSSTTLDRGSAWPAPAPRVGDLLRVVAGGTAGTSDFHRISAVSGSTVTVEPGLDFATGSATVHITAGARIATGTGAVTPTTVLTNAAGNFVGAGVKPGFTLVAVSGALEGQRRQISAVTATQLTLASGFSATADPVDYEVVNSLATYGGTSASQEDEWLVALTEQLRALEGQDFIDFSDRIVEQAAAQSITVGAINMGAFSSLLVFVAVEHATNSSLTSVTFGGSPLTAKLAASADSLGVHVYLGQGLTGTQDLVVTATSASPTPNLKVYALKLSALKNLTAATAAVNTVATPFGTAGLKSIEAGDLAVSFVCCVTSGNRIFPMQGHDTLVPRFSGNGLSAILTATRASTANEAISPQFVVAGSNATARVATVVITKDPGADPIVGRAIPEKVALTRFLDGATPDRGLGELIGSITSASTLTGDLSSLSPSDVVVIRSGPNAGVYTIASASSATCEVTPQFPAGVETGVRFKAGKITLIPKEVLADALAAYGMVETAIVSAGQLRLLLECPIVVYRSASTTDSSFTRTSGRMEMGGARARGTTTLTTRRAEIQARAANSVQTLEDILSSGGLYDGRFVWIDSRINLETGILPKRDRAVANRLRTLETTVKNLTKLLTL